MDWVKPMEPVLRVEPFDDDNFFYQVKWDGIRLLCYISEDRIELRTRKGSIRTKNYPELLNIRQCFQGRQAIFDGEAVVFGEEGIPSFNRILKRDLSTPVDKDAVNKDLLNKFPVVYMVFDILYCEGTFLDKVPLNRRQELLGEKLKVRGNIMLCDNYSQGTGLFEVMKEKGMEGIVAKEKNGFYHFGKKHPTWQKVKCLQEMTAFAGGMTFKGGRLSGLLLGVYEGDDFFYVGRASAGLNEKQRRELEGFARECKKEEPPFTGRLTAERGVDIIWLFPVLRVRVQYLEKSGHGTFRHPVIKEIML